MKLDPIEAYLSIREACLKRPELRFKGWPEEPKDIPDDSWGLTPYQGFCYISTQVFCHLIPDAKPYKMRAPWHYYAMIDDKVWDLTAEQFKYRLEYKILGVRTRFKNPLCERAEELYYECSGIN